MRYTQPLSNIRRADRLEPRRRPLWRGAVSAPVWSFAWLLAVAVVVTGCGGGPSTPHVASGATHDHHHRQPVGPQLHAGNGPFGVRVVHALTRGAELPRPQWRRRNP